MPTKSEQLNGVLAALRKAVGVQGSAVLSRDGITIVADLPTPASRETFSAMAAAMLGAAETAMIEIGQHVPQRVILENPDVRLVASGINNDLLLVVIAKTSAPLAGLVKDLQSATDAVRKIMG